MVIKTANVIKGIALLAMLLAFTACLKEDDGFNSNEQFKADLKAIDQYLDENNIDATIDSASEIRYVVHNPGDGVLAEAGDTIQVHYGGFLLNEDKFDSSIDRGSPFEFILGAGQVISGWEIAFSILEKNSEATIYLPSAYAYGRNGTSDGSIPPNTPIFFEVQFLDIKAK